MAGWILTRPQETDVFPGKLCDGALVRRRVSCPWKTLPLRSRRLGGPNRLRRCSPAPFLREGSGGGGGGRLRVMGMSGTQKSDESRFGKPSGPVGCPLGLGLPRVLLQVKIRAHPYPGLGRLFGPAWHPCL